VPRTKVKTTGSQADRQVGLDAAKAVKDLKVESLILCCGQDSDPFELFDGFAAGSYSCAFFKSSHKQDISKFPKTIGLLGADVNEATISQKREFSKANLLCRFLQDAPPNFLHPESWAEIAQDIAKEGGVKCQILDEKEMEKLGMGSFLSVGKSGHKQPRTIIIEIDGEDNSKTVALIGKGLTFDTGGISIKPSPAMDEMKYDMSGGAAVMGAAKYLMHHKPPTKVVCLIGAAENMPSHIATRPGDIVKAMNGKTIEVLNTDAEGRLVLADVVCYAVKNYKPDMMIDIATLTGAVLHALGCAGSALMSNDKGTAAHILKAAHESGEPFWELPMWPELDKETASKFSDVQNIAKPNVKAGSIMGGVFLKEFVDNHKWAHLDIAATGWNCQATGYPSSGGSAFGVRTLVQSCLNFK
jgi:leucyl aminopeptidase